jgi:hypothetical protein
VDLFDVERKEDRWNVKNVEAVFALPPSNPNSSEVDHHDQASSSYFPSFGHGFQDTLDRQLDGSKWRQKLDNNYRALPSPATIRIESMIVISIVGKCDWQSWSSFRAAAQSAQPSY